MFALVLTDCTHAPDDHQEHRAHRPGSPPVRGRSFAAQILQQVLDRARLLQAHPGREGV